MTHTVILDKFVVHEAGPSFPSTKKQLLSRYFVEPFTHAGQSDIL